LFNKYIEKIFENEIIEIIEKLIKYFSEKYQKICKKLLTERLDNDFNITDMNNFKVNIFYIKLTILY